MESNAAESDDAHVSLRPVGQDNWRNVAKLKVSEAQREFVAEPSYYLTLCCYGNDFDCDLCGAWVVFYLAAKLEEVGPQDS